MNTFQLEDPNPRINFKLQEAALYMLQHGVILEGAYCCDNKEMAWRITPAEASGYTCSDCQVSIIKRGVWVDIGTFTIHENTIDTIIEYLETELAKIILHLG